MIQRRQTLFLLLVTVLMGIMLNIPLGKFLVGDEEFVMKAFGVFSVAEANLKIVGTPYMGILIIMATVLPFLTVFFYKFRMLQIRLCFMEMVFLLGVQIFVGFYLYHATTGFSDIGREASIVYSVVDLMPLLSLVLMWMAYRGIVRDEALVRSLDRIR